MPKGYIIGHITVKDPEAYKEYVERDTPILEGYGGRFIVEYQEVVKIRHATADSDIILVEGV